MIDKAAIKALAEDIADRLVAIRRILEDELGGRADLISESENLIAFHLRVLGTATKAVIRECEK